MMGSGFEVQGFCDFESWRDAGKPEVGKPGSQEAGTAARGLAGKPGFKSILFELGS